MQADSKRMTIDGLAHESGTAASTIRLYQTRGLLPAPVKDGRVGYYGEGHLARLRLIATMQEQGFSLTSIGRLVDAWEHGRGLDTLLGLEDQVTRTWAGEEPLARPLAELADQFPPGALSTDLMQRAMALDLLSIKGDQIVVHSPRFLEIGAELARMGIPVEEIIDEYEYLQEVTATVADRFASLFDRHLWSSVASRGLPPDDIRELTAVLERLSVLAEAVVTLTLRQSLKRAAAGFLSGQAGPLTGPTGQ